MTVANVPTLRTMLETGQPLAVPDTELDTRWTLFPELLWVRSYAGAPIRTKEGAIGFLQVSNARPNFYTQIHAERLQAVQEPPELGVELRGLPVVERVAKLVADGAAFLLVASLPFAPMRARMGRVGNNSGKNRP